MHTHLISNVIAPARFMRSSPYIYILIAERALAATCGDPIKASQNMFIPTDIPHCSLCNVRSDDLKISLKKCAKCNKELYCSRECQVVDWSLNHKFKCIARADSTPANSA